MSKPLEDYALVSDCHSAALISKDGSIDWLCFPAFDSPACFASLLGDKDNGRWLIKPEKIVSISRKYLPGTMVLETTFETSTGTCRIIDCMLFGEADPTLIRKVEGIQGTVDLYLELIIRFDYGSIVPWVRRNKDDDGIHAVAGPEGLVFYSPFHLHGENLHTVSHFSIKEEEKVCFSLSWFKSHLSVPKKIVNSEEAINKTIQWWKEWSIQNKYKGFDHEAVERSLITLKGLTYLPTGAILAAPTTSLPESIGGIRNWDYRYGWIRDSSFTLLALLMAGYQEEAICWEDWLLRSVAGTPSQANIMYGIRGERRLTEIELEWLNGYEDSRPVRIGNMAYKQFQLDVFGELLTASYLGRRFGIRINENTWRIEKKMISFVCEHWQEPDEGIWEVRGPKRHFTHSKMMAWVALNSAIKTMKHFGLIGDHKFWTQKRDQIHADICKQGFNCKLNSFVQTYGSNDLDASLLMMAIVGFLPPHDPRIVGTIENIQKNLTKNGLVYRYLTNGAVDGLPGKEGAFIPCTFWLIINLSMMGRKQEARELYDHVLSLRNDVGLFSEEYSTTHNRLVGNFPQAFSHIAQIGAAMEIDGGKRWKY